jgi:hypothetical protein
MDARARLFGVRHHGPGSAALLKRALDALDPDAVLVEGPPEADALVASAALPGTRPPVALLAYSTERPKLAAFYPFAEYSPEWQAIRWALERGKPVRFIDWPAAASLAFDDPASRIAEALDLPDEGAWTPDGPDALAEGDGAGEPTGEDVGQAARVDPLDLLAEAGGYPDGESFWNATVEQRAAIDDDPFAAFDAVENAMAAAREASEPDEGDDSRHARRERAREAFMRLAIRRALTDFTGDLAAVVGAWHVPALRRDVPPSRDRDATRDLPRVKAAVAWTPWTNGRLTAASGYGAGIRSPGWYEHLWSVYARGGESPSGAIPLAAGWQARTASVLRRAGHAASTASAIEAARLALSLASMRGLESPGIPEMGEAALAVLCGGEPVKLAVVERELYVGERLGTLDPAIPQAPLQEDLAAWQRKTRLAPSASPEDLSLDLRTEAGSLKSTLLHRLLLIDVPWGTLVDAEAGRGTFRELWRLEWKPEFAVALAEALVYGVTVERAASGKAREAADAASAVPDLAELVRAALVADLPDASSYAIARLQRLAADSGDMSALMRSVTPLAKALRYGTSRRLPERELADLIRAVSAEVVAGFRHASRGLDREAAAERAAAARSFDAALSLFQDGALTVEWQRQLASLSRDERASPTVVGAALRCLHDSGARESAWIVDAFSWRVRGQEPEGAGDFLEAFLEGGAEPLLHDRALLAPLDAWVAELDEEGFVAAVPLLRRCFSGFDASARRRLFQALAMQPSGPGGQGDAPRADDASEAAFAEALPLILKLLGAER